MIRANQIPDEVVEAAREAWDGNYNWHQFLAAALNAWPRVRLKLDGRYALLPLPQEASDE